MNMTDSRIAIRKETRDLVKSQKRGGETYDSLLRKMIDQYDPHPEQLEDFRVPVIDPETGEGHDEWVQAINAEQAMRMVSYRVGEDHHISSTFLRKHGLGPEEE